MYTSYFGLTEKPFAIAPNPRYLYMSELHREALAHLMYGISNDGCIILLTGDVGTGKTTVCRCLLEQLPDSTDVALILNPKLSITDLLKTICEELKIELPDSTTSIKTFIDYINSYLLDAHSRGRNTAVIIDEAQNLDPEILEQLRLLTNLETNTNKLLQIILIGQPELRNILSDPRLSQINQRITTRYHLTPLHEDDITTYISHRLAIAGGNSRSILFTEQALQYVARISKGIPRVINILCDHALLGAYANNSDHVNLEIMKRAAGELETITPKKSSLLRPMILPIGLLLLVIALSISFIYIDERDNLSILKQNIGLLWQSSHPERVPNTLLPTPAGE